MFKSSGRLIYDPHKNTKGRVLKPANYWVILKTDEEIIRYYQHWLQLKSNVKFEKTLWGSHISVNRGVVPINSKLWNKHKNKVFTFLYSNVVKPVNNLFYYVDVISPDLEDIRDELGLPRLPNNGFHLTIGRVSPIIKAQPIRLT